jgi:hypothetical protein
MPIANEVSRNNAEDARVLQLRKQLRTEAHLMKRATHPFLAVVLLAFTSLASAQTETQSTTAQQETTPSAASSPHQRQTTESATTEAATARESDPASASTQHQQDTTRTRTAEGEGEDQAVKECVEELKEKNKGIPDYTARKACREHVRKQGTKSAEG